MITVEELIVQGLYHRLVLITVRRSPDKPSNTGDQPESDRKDGDNSETAQPASQGLGFLHLGDLPVPAESCIQSANDLSTPPTGFNTAESQALMQSLGVGAEGVTVTRHVRQILDVGDQKLVQTLLRSAEVQTDFEPMWCFGQSTTTMTTASRPDDNSHSSVLPFVEAGQHAKIQESSPTMIDLRNCSQFSIVRMEDMRDPGGQSLVMVQTDRGSATDGDDKKGMSTRSTAPVADRAAIYIEDSRGQFRQEFKNLSSLQSLRDADSGVWDMMQALDSGSGNIIPGSDLSRIDLFRHTSSRRSSIGENMNYSGLVSTEAVQLERSSKDLYGTYQSYQIADQTENKPSTIYKTDVDVAVTRPDTNIESPRSGDRGGLSTVLEPRTVVNFVVHRVEVETVHLEAVDQTIDTAAAGHEVKHSSNRARSTDRWAKNENVLKCFSNGADSAFSETLMGDDPEMVAGYVRAKHGSGGQSPTKGRGVHDRSRKDHKVNGNSANSKQSIRRRSSDLYDDDDNITPESYRDIVEITSVHLRRPDSPSSRSIDGDTLTTWRSSSDFQEETRRWKKRELAKRSRSERSSPFSSMLDVSSRNRAPPSADTARAGGAMRRSLIVLSPHSSPTRKPHYRSTPATNTSPQHSPYYPLASSPSCETWPRITGDRCGSENFSDWFGDESSACLSLEQEIIDFPRFVDWMKKLPPELQSIPLSSLCIPGSHISVAIERDMHMDMDFSKCNYEMAEFLRKLPNLAVFNNFRSLMKGIWKSWMPKQCLSVHDQLAAGARYLEIRVTKYNNNLYGEHGLYTRQIRKYLREVRLFVEEQPTEVVVLHFQMADEFLDRADKRRLVTQLFQVFGSKMACASGGDVSMLPSLRQLWDDKKHVIVFFPCSDMDLIQNHIFGGLVWSDECVRMVLPKKQTVDELIDYLDETYAASSGSKDRRSGALHVTKAVLSPDMSMVFGKFEYKSMRELAARETCSAVCRWLEGKQGLNVVAVDFVGVGGVIDAILQLNYFDGSISSAATAV